MSIFCSNNFTATPNRVEMFIDFLKSTNKFYTKKQLQEMFSPNSEAVFNEVFRVAQILDLITIEMDSVKLNLNKKNNSYQLIQSAVFDLESSTDNFLIALSWFLSLDKNNLPTWNDNLTGKLENDLNGLLTESLSVQSWQNFVYWIQYLGFATKLTLGDNIYIIPDPTTAIKLIIKKLFIKDKELKIHEFLSSLSNKYSVLEFGKNRKYINDYLRDGLKLPENKLSYSLSIAISRLEKLGIVELITKADADVISVELKRVSHIKFLGLKD
jgi:hypothetical protein